LPVDVDETRKVQETPEGYVLRLALAKARAGWQAQTEARLPVLAADTAVVVNGEVLGKPRGPDDGLAMLEKLSGRSHQVLSAVALVGQREATRLSESAVTFRTLSERERLAYWASGEGADKAGGYAIQGRAAVFVQHLSGSYSGVMGLPLYETAQLLDEFGIAIWNSNHREP
jgi:septum formation protein